MLPRFLYHGTYGGAHNGVLFHGLQPRERTGKSNWKDHTASREDAVYLTDTYATFYADRAYEQSTKGLNLVIYEIDTFALDKNNLCADEDVLQQWAREGVKDSMKVALRAGSSTDFASDFMFSNQHKHMHHVSAERSLEALGVCAHVGKIPLQAISRGLFYGVATADLMRKSLDVVNVNLKHFEEHGENYQQALRWLFRFDEQNMGALRDVTFDAQPGLGGLVNWPQFNFWRNKAYTGDAEFIDVEQIASTILIPAEELKHA